MVGPILDQCVLLEEKNKKYFLLTIPYSCMKELDRSISWDSHGKWIDTNTDMSGFPGGFPVCVILQADYRHTLQVYPYVP